MVILQQPLDADFGVIYLFEAFAAKLCQPQLKWFGFGRGDGLNEAKQLLYIGDVGHSHFAVRGFHFQVYDFIVHFTPFAV